MCRQVLAVLLVGQTLFAAERSAVRTDWDGFREQVTKLKLKNRGARIGLTAGGEVKTLVLRAEENGLVVRADSAVSQWRTSDTEAMVPRDSVASVRFGGRIGHRGLIGGLAGLALGGAIGAGAAASANGGIESDIAIAGAIVLPLFLGGIGYLAGHFSDRHAPSFSIVH